MRKTWLVFGFLACVLIFTSGCSKNNKTVGPKGNFNNQKFGGATSTDRFAGLSFTTSTMSELKVGDKIVVTGTSNPDGSVNATRIMVGDLPRGNGDFNTSTRSLRQGASNNQSNNNQPPSGLENGNMTPPQNGDGQNHPNGIPGQGNFQADRQNQNNWGNGDNAQNRRGGFGTRGGMIIGEILSKSDNNLIVKMVDGGSKIVFFSTETKILKFNPATTTSSAPETGNGNQR